jgi:hypothetical protein
VPAIPLAVPLLWLAAFVVAYGALAAYRGQSEDADGSIKGLLLWLAAKIDAVRIPIPGHSTRVLGPIADAFVWVANAIENALAAVVGWFEAPVAQFLYLLTEVPAQTARSLASFATATAHTIGRIRTVEIPQAIRQALYGATSSVAAAIAAIKMVRAHAIPALWGGLEHVGGRVKRVERDAARTARRLRRAEAYLTAAGMVVIVATALGRLGLKWVRCRNVSKVGRRVCSMDFDYLDALLAGSLLVVGSVSIVDFAHELQDAEGEVVKAIRGLVREA